MSIYNRDYMREDSSGKGSWSVITWLLVINIAVYLAQIFFLPDEGVGILGLSLEALQSGKIWTPITYQFAHGSPMHIIGNMLILFFLGRMLVQLTTPRVLLRIYLLGGLAGGIVQLLYNFAIGPDAATVGASASVLAIVIAVAAIIPHQSITLLLFFIIPVKLTMRQIAIILVVINAATLAYDLAVPASAGNIAVMAHFGGMLFGWLYIRYWMPSREGRPERPKKKSAFAEKFGVRILKDEGKKKNFVNQDVDAILDKINAEGFQSLTEEERKALERSSQKLSKRIDKES